MLLKLLQDGFGSAMDLNCAEKILYGANWAYNMKLPGEALKLAAGFGGGMGVESSCGVITGGNGSPPLKVIPLCSGVSFGKTSSASCCGEYSVPPSKGNRSGLWQPSQCRGQP